MVTYLQKNNKTKKKTNRELTRPRESCANSEPEPMESEPADHVDPEHADTVEPEPAEPVDPELAEAEARNSGT